MFGPIVADIRKYQTFPGLYEYHKKSISDGKIREMESEPTLIESFILLFL